MFVEILPTVNPFELIVILPIFAVIAFETAVAPLLETVIFPLLFATVPEIVAKPALFEILILPVSLETAFDIVKPFNEEITTSPVYVFITVPAISRFWASFVFVIEIPSVAVTFDVFVNVKLPSVFSMAIVPEDVSIFEAIFALAPSVEILIFPLAFIISPFILLVPLMTVIVVLPSLFITEAFCW